MPEYVFPVASPVGSAANRGTIISEAILKAGNNGIADRAKFWLNQELDALYAAYNWPFLTQRFGPYSLGTGVSSFEIGDGTNTASKLQHVVAIQNADSLNTGHKGYLWVNDNPNLGPNDDNAWLDSASPAMPSEVTVEVATSGGYTQPYRWKVLMNRHTDKAYRVLVIAKMKPEQLTDDAQIPLYPSTRTLVQGVYLQALKYMDEKTRVPYEETVLKTYIAEDKVAFGRRHGQQKVGLSSRTFPRGRRNGSWF